MSKTAASADAAALPETSPRRTWITIPATDLINTIDGLNATTAKLTCTRLALASLSAEMPAERLERDAVHDMLWQAVDELRDLSSELTERLDVVRPVHSPDAQLVDLGEMLRIAHEEERAVSKRWDGIDSPQGDAEVAAANDRCRAIADLIEATCAHSLAGLMAKARAVAWCRNDDPFSASDISDADFGPKKTTDMRIALGIANDLMAMVA